MDEVQIVWLVIGGSVLFAAVIITFALRRASALGDRLMRMVTSFGWEGTRRKWWNGALLGRWRGFNVELQHMNRYKGIPERLLLTVHGESPARVIVKRRTGGFLNKPMTMFGPPLIEPRTLVQREEYWIRSDQQMFAETMLSRPELAALLDPNLIAAFDLVDLETHRLRILRAIDERAVKQRFGRPFMQWRRDYELIETIAGEEWKLAAAMVDAGGLRPSD